MVLTGGLDLSEGSFEKSLTSERVPACRLKLDAGQSFDAGCERCVLYGACDGSGLERRDEKLVLRSSRSGGFFDSSC